MISYQEFRRLWIDAQEIEDLDQYVAEVGGSVPLDDVEQALTLLRLVHRMARGTASELRSIAQLTQAAMPREYGVPSSTVNKWDMGSSNPPEWVRELLAYAIASDLLGRG